VDPISVWHGDHMRFARLLDFLERQMAAFHEGEDPKYELMRDVVFYLHEYADHIHHPREDVAFDCLMRRDPAMKQTVKQLLQEHRAIHASAEGLLTLLEAILEDALIERSSVEAAAALYLVYYRQHLSTEEREIMPRAAQVLTPEDWAAVANAVSNTPDPLFGSEVAARYRQLRDWITRAQ